ncbi:MAG: hypothetical protein KDC44_00635, partial [Phaeodactylibacter sp.]|nr:hypothetical protein [Phaeodactylibacter sp.]
MTSATPNPNVPEFLPDPTQVGGSFALDIAIGNNSAEALSAIISKKEVVQPIFETETAEPYPDLEKQVELLFNAFQQGLLRKLQGTDPSLRAPQLEEYLHSRRFSSHSGGMSWMVSPRNEQGTTSTQSAGETGLPLEAAALLSLLNTTQEQYNREAAALLSRHQQAFLDWTNYGLIIQADNPPNNTTDVLSYIESELLKIFTEDALTGHISTETTGQSLQFNPTWTNINTVAEQQVLNWGAAQTQLWYGLDLALAAIQTQLNQAKASLATGNTTAALAFLKATQSGAIGTDWQGILQFFQTGGTALVQSLQSAIQTLQAEQSIINLALNGNGTNNPGLLTIKAEMGQFNEINDIGTFIDQQTGPLFTTLHLIDTQSIFVFAEAVNFAGLDPSIPGAKLLDAIAEAQNKLTVISKQAIPNMQAAQTALQQILSSTWTQLNSIQASIQQAVSALGQSSGAATALDAVNTAITTAGTVVAGRPSRQKAGLALQAAWMPLLQQLPTAHQALILAQLLQQMVVVLEYQNSLQAIPAKAYYAPSDPVVLITEPKDAANVLNRVDRNGKASSLPCRLPGQLLQSLQLNNAAAITPSVLAAKSAAPKVYSNLGALQPVIQQLLYEGYFLMPQAAYDLAATVAGQAAALSNSLICVQGNLLDALAKAQKNQSSPPLQSNPSGQSSEGGALTAAYTGTMPYYIGANWLGDFYFNPFLPLYMAWTATFNPLALVDGQGNDQKKSVYPEGYLLDNFQLDTEDVNLICNKAMGLQATGTEAVPVKLNGQIPLASTASLALLQQIKVYFLDNLGIDISKQGSVDPSKLNDFQKDLYETYEYFDQKTILSQSLSGLHSSLLEQLKILQLPINQRVDPSDQVVAPLFKFLADKWVDPAYSQATVGQNLAATLFLPFRAGIMELQELQIVDAFGRYFQIGDPASGSPVQDQLIVASSLQPAATCAEKNIYLAPRFVQPARLDFSWLSAAGVSNPATGFVEQTGQPTASPICGWMLPNHLENSLVLYDAQGNPLGALGLEGNNQTLTWRSVPQSGTGGGTGSPDNGRSQMLKDIATANPQLQDFLEQFAFPASNPSDFQAFLAVTEKSQQFIHTPGLQQSKGLSVLMGRPLVLARAQLQLQLLGTAKVALTGNTLWDAVNQFT